MVVEHSLLDMQEVTKVYPLAKREAVTAVRNVNLSVDAGEFVVITGRSGSGKTTLLNLASGLTRPTTGQVLLGGTEVWRLSDDDQSRLRNTRIGFVFQFPSLIPTLTSLENVLLPTIADRKDRRAGLRLRAEELLEEVGLSDKRDALPRQLSAGQQQRVVVARALIRNSQLLLADEPTSNLDEQTEHEILALLQRIHASGSLTILLVTHSMELARYGTRGIRMANGAIVSEVPHSSDAPASLAPGWSLHTLEELS